MICGHIHHPVIRDVDGMTYVNTGDFVESCSYVVEHDDGRLEVHALVGAARAASPARTAPAKTAVGGRFEAA